MRIISASRMQIFFKVRLITPFLHPLPPTLRIAASMSAIGAVVGEWIGATRDIWSADPSGDLMPTTPDCFMRPSSWIRFLAGGLFLAIAYDGNITIVWPSEDRTRPYRIILKMESGSTSRRARSELPR